LASNQELPPWTWTTPEDEKQHLTATGAIAGAFAAATAGLPSGRGPRTLVIANHLPMLRQQQLIDACRSLGCDVKLLWRPVAGALAWCKMNGQRLLDSDTLQHESMGTLVCIHLGIEQFEFSTIELRRKFVNGSPVIIPARRRPPSSLRPFPSIGLEMLHRMAEVDDAVPSERSSQRQKWKNLWASSWPAATIRQLCQVNSDLPSALLVRRHFGKIHSSPPTANWNDAVWAGDRLQVSRFQEVWSERSGKVIEELSKHKIVGAVITGELASVFLADNRTLSQQVLSDLRVILPPDRILLDNEAISQHSILADGAALYSAMIAEGKPTYLDTLPRIQFAAYVTGTPGWLPLLNDADDYVDGGKIWHRPAPVSVLSITVHFYNRMNWPHVDGAYVSRRLLVYLPQNSPIVYKSI